MKDVTGAYLAYQVHPGHAGLVDEDLQARRLYYSVGFREFTRDAPLIKTKAVG